MRICAVVGCSNSTYQLQKWRKGFCTSHNCHSASQDCVCPDLFQLYPFPTLKGDPEKRNEWVKSFNRKNPKTGKNWQPSEDDRVCSKHFVDGQPTVAHPCPTVDMGYNYQPKKHQVRAARKTRTTQKFTKYSPAEKKPKTEVDQTDVKGDSSGEAELKQTVVNMNKSIKHDHDYIYECDCVENCVCSGCFKKQKVIDKLQLELEGLKTENALLRRQATKGRNVVDKFLKTDVKIRAYTGLPNKKTFNNLVKYVTQKSKKLHYWSGSKKAISTKVRRNFKASPKKTGPQRKLSVKEELTLVLLKLRTAITNEMLADLFDISNGGASQVINTWVKFLAFELKPLIFWPSKEAIRESLPKSLKHYPNLRCTIDCSEIFIDRPRNLEIQALTWSDYKKHNTVKFLVGIAPNGMISFLSKAWGGRASDQYITRESGFLNLLEPTDLIMADRGFTIKEDLMVRGATLEIPPPSSGLEQMSKDKVNVTKKIANARIHVERAIGRMKVFSILKKTLPITLVPLIDDILVVCAGISNLLPPLVQ